MKKIYIETQENNILNNVCIGLVTRSGKYKDNSEITDDIEHAEIIVEKKDNKFTLKKQKESYKSFYKRMAKQASKLLGWK